MIIWSRRKVDGSYGGIWHAYRTSANIESKAVRSECGLAQAPELFVNVEMPTLSATDPVLICPRCAAMHKFEMPDAIDNLDAKENVS